MQSGPSPNDKDKLGGRDPTPDREPARKEDPRQVGSGQEDAKNNGNDSERRDRIQNR